jgi:hypothetical protein
MILEEGTDEQLKCAVGSALLPAVGSRWVWADSAHLVYTVTKVDKDVVLVRFNGAQPVLEFIYSTRYWVQRLVGTPQWRQL